MTLKSIDVFIERAKARETRRIDVVAEEEAEEEDDEEESEFEN